jgi:acyl-CoA synthetase (AMP-forming)/AMP-acid ligase II
MRNLMLISIFALLLGGCTFVKLTPQGENVAILQASEVGNCTANGTVTAHVTSKVVVNRQPAKVAQELRTVARNDAADRGDTLVAANEPRNGEQTFNIYRCRR